MRHSAIPICLIAGLLALTAGCEMAGRKKADFSSRQAYYLHDGPLDQSTWSAERIKAFEQSQTKVFEQYKLEQQKLKSEMDDEEQ